MRCFDSTWAAFRVLMPVIGVIAAVMGTVALTLVLATIDARLMLVPVAVVGTVLVWFLRRERRVTGWCHPRAGAARVRRQGSKARAAKSSRDRGRR